MSWWRGALTKGCCRLLASTPPSRYNSRSLAYTKSFSSSPSQAEDCNIVSILRNEIQHKSVYAPPTKPVTKFGRFIVEDHRGEKWITLRNKISDDWSVKIEVTMFDDAVNVPVSADDSTAENLRLHISMLVDIWKGDESQLMEFVCSAWPDSLEIDKVYIFRRDESLLQPYMGPNMKKLKPELQTEFYNFLKKRGIDDELPKFLHDYMMNKHSIEFMEWLNKVESYFER